MLQNPLKRLSKLSYTVRHQWFQTVSFPYVMAFHVAVQGHLHTYRFCDNVWTFILTDATFKSEEISETLGKVKIVACDSKLLQPHQP